MEMSIMSNFLEKCQNDRCQCQKINKTDIILISMANPLTTSFLIVKFKMAATIKNKINERIV